MGKGDGTVLGVHSVINNGPTSKRWNLVIVAEGYASGELGQFATDATRLANAIVQTPPFNSVRGAINVLRLDVESTQSGADDPVCGGTGTGVTRATYFDAAFCKGGESEILVVKRQLVKETLAARIDKWHTALVLVNSPKYGGSGYHQVAVCSKHTDAVNLALHEVGHSGFGLFDEYEGGNGTRHPGNEPGGCNVTVAITRPQLKWQAHVLPTTAIPTHSKPACALQLGQPLPQQGPVPPGTIGTFEGADEYDCGSYRPAADCKMRTLTAPFCKVCSEHIRSTLLPFTAP